MIEINPHTKVCALIGNPVEHSLSPSIHNAAFAASALNFIYVAFRVVDLGAALSGMRALENFRGASVTIPHKVEAIKYLEDIDPLAKKIGSINTIVIDQGSLKGYSTDGPGVIKALRDRDIKLDGRNILILGSGGAARAIAFNLALNTKINKIDILGIIKEEINGLVKDVSASTGTNIYGKILHEKSLKMGLEGSDIIIQATPVGMYPRVEETLIPKGLLREGLIVFDIVYNPLRTKLLQNAQDAGCITIPGWEMFVNQAVVQFELWTGREAPVEVMREVALKHLIGKQI